SSWLRKASDDPGTTVQASQGESTDPLPGFPLLPRSQRRSPPPEQPLCHREFLSRRCTFYSDGTDCEPQSESRVSLHLSICSLQRWLCPTGQREGGLPRSAIRCGKSQIRNTSGPTASLCCPL